MAKKSKVFDPIDGNRVFSRVNEITGLPLVKKGKDWHGACYLNGAPHERQDKTVVSLIRGNVVLLEQGGDCMNIVQWLVQFGGASGYAHAFDILRGADKPLISFDYEPVIREVRYVYQEVLSKAKNASNSANSTLSLADNTYALENNTLFRWMCGMFPESDVRRVWDMYNVTSNKWGNVVFWYMDSEGRICRDKVMKYNADGHRNRTFGGYTEFTVKNGFIGRCCFGEHLIDDEKPVACCESEKTALLGSLYYPEYTWVATGGKSKVSLADKSWILYPDMDAIEDWRAHGEVKEWWNEFDDVPENGDIGDMIVKIKNKSL